MEVQLTIWRKTRLHVCRGEEKKFIEASYQPVYANVERDPSHAVSRYRFGKERSTGRSVTRKQFGKAEDLVKTTDN
jgi:hypothetical protein